ncbi:MAG: lysophospholipid acyltransferase family protein [Polyangia bacterium]|jgi:1-acyl-sn-glycerol-3-phosphate acyltransferase|nr:lysophospholipid acyltransferase family protein [Polyangia bacterium]
MVLHVRPALPKPPEVDYDLARKVARVVGPLLKAYFRTRVEGLENIPAGRSLLVGVHSGGIVPVDALALGAAFYEHFEYQRSLQFLAHQLLWRISPEVTRIMEGIGGVEASPESGQALLEAERTVMVYPGGTYEVFRPFWERNRIDWNGHMGYVRLAVRTRTPIVPVPSVGAHEQFIGLTRGLALNRLVGLGKLLGRVEILPLLWTFPFGPTVAFLPPYLPLPAQVTVRCEEPMELHSTAAGRQVFRRNPKGDPEHLMTLHRMVQARMQAGLDGLARGRIPFLGRIPALERLGRVLGARPDRPAA